MPKSLLQTRTELQGSGTEAHVAELADRLRDAVNGSYEVGGVPDRLSASVGSMWSPIDDIDALLRNADAHMYTQKA